MLNTELTDKGFVVGMRAPEVIVRPPMSKFSALWWYPGWPRYAPDHPFGGLWTEPWSLILDYLDRLPPGGPQDERLQSVVDDLMTQMLMGGFDVAFFNYYYKGQQREPFLGHAIDRFMTSKVPGLKFAAAFEPQTAIPPITSLSDWHHLCDSVFAPMFNHPAYFTHNGRPLWINLRLEHMHSVIGPSIGRTQAQMLQELRNRTGKNVYAVAAATGTSHWMATARDAGYTCFTQYNGFNTWPDRDTPVAGPQPTSVDELEANYRAERLGQIAALAAFGLEFIAPWTSGWSPEPWGQPPIGIHTPAQLQAALRRLRADVESSPRCIGSVGYALNENGEGAWMQSDAVLGFLKMLIHAAEIKGRGLVHLP